MRLTAAVVGWRTLAVRGRHPLPRSPARRPALSPSRLLPSVQQVAHRESEEMVEEIMRLGQQAGRAGTSPGSGERAVSASPSCGSPQRLSLRPEIQQLLGELDAARGHVQTLEASGISFSYDSRILSE